MLGPIITDDGMVISTGGNPPSLPPDPPQK